MGFKATLAFACIITIAATHGIHAAASAEPRSSPAKGDHRCVIKQHSSEYLVREHELAKAQTGVSFYMQTMSYLAFKVLKSGAVLVSMKEDVYPGSNFYFMIDGKRYSGPASHYVQLDSFALSALKQDRLIDFTYTNWPYRNEISRKDIFSGFSQAYEECLTFLGGKPKPPNPFPAPIGTPPKN